MLEIIDSKITELKLPKRSEVEVMPELDTERRLRALVNEYRPSHILEVKFDPLNTRAPQVSQDRISLIGVRYYTLTLSRSRFVLAPDSTEPSLSSVIVPPELKPYQAPVGSLDLKLCRNLNSDSTEAILGSDLKRQSGVSISATRPNDWKSPGAEANCYAAFNFWAHLLPSFIGITETNRRILRHFRDGKFPVVPDSLTPGANTENTPGLMPEAMADPETKIPVTEEFWYHVTLTAGTYQFTWALVTLATTPEDELLQDQAAKLKESLEQIQTAITTVFTPLAVSVQARGVINQMILETTALFRYTQPKIQALLHQFHTDLVPAVSSTEIIKAMRRLHSQGQQSSVSAQLQAIEAGADYNPGSYSSVKDLERRPTAYVNDMIGLVRDLYYDLTGGSELNIPSR